MGHLSLKNLLTELNCPCDLNFHNAGNDANLTLRALLLLGVKAIEENNIMPERVEILRRVAVEAVLSRRKQKRYRRKAAKMRTFEEQEEIRAERRQRAELNHWPVCTTSQSRF
jgi:hypothetical protein